MAAALRKNSVRFHATWVAPPGRYRLERLWITDLFPSTLRSRGAVEPVEPSSPATSPTTSAHPAFPRQTGKLMSDSARVQLIEIAGRGFEHFDLVFAPLLDHIDSSIDVDVVRRPWPVGAREKSKIHEATMHA